MNTCWVPIVYIINTRRNVELTHQRRNKTHTTIFIKKIFLPEKSVGFFFYFVLLLMWLAALQASDCGKPRVLTDFIGIHHYAALECSQDFTALHFFSLSLQQKWPTYIEIFTYRTLLFQNPGHLPIFLCAPNSY